MPNLILNVFIFLSFALSLPLPLSLSSDKKKKMNRFYKQISRQKWKNINEGVDECKNLPHQDKVCLCPSFNQKQKGKPTSKKRKTTVDAGKIKYKDSAHVHDKLEDLSVEIDNWEGKQTQTKSARKLQKIQNKILKGAEVIWECHVTYSTPIDWRFGELKVCKKKKVVRKSLY